MDLALTSPADLEAHGFAYLDGAAPVTFGPAGLAVAVDGSTYAEWFQSAPGDWFAGATGGAGWWAETELTVDGSGCAQAGLWIHDGTDLVQWTTGAGEAVGLYPSGASTGPLGAGSHDVLIIGNADRSTDVWVDGERLIRHASARGGGGSEVFGLSTHASCATTVVWSALSYGAPALDLTGDDSDGDGVLDVADLCVDQPDDQADADGDRAGDACDPCPLDPLDDADGDGACADVDACPNDASATAEPCPTYNQGYPSDPTYTLDQGMAGTGGSAKATSCGCATGPTGGSLAWIGVIAGVAARRRYGSCGVPPRVARK